MDNIFPKPLWAISVALFLSACVSPAPHGDYAPDLADNSSDWQLPVSAHSGHIVSKLTLSSRDRLEVSVDDKRGEALATMHFSDDECDFGHDAYISYYGQTRSVEHRFYFDSQIPWNEPIALAIRWDGEGQLLVDLNGQAYPVHLNGAPRSVQVQASRGQPDITEFRYQALQTQETLLQ